VKSKIVVGLAAEQDVKTIPSESFSQKFEAHLDEFKAREKWNRFQQADKTFLLMYLEMYCALAVTRPGKQERSSFQRRPRKTRRRPTSDPERFVERKRSLAVAAKNLAEQLANDADEIETMSREPEVLQAFSRSTFAPRPHDLANDLREYSSVLRRASEGLQGSWSRTYREEPGNILRLLADYIKQQTGEDRYADLALLVRVAYAAIGKHSDCDGELVRKIVKRARERYV